jgi:Tol biopolymer transport system component
LAAAALVAVVLAIMLASRRTTTRVPTSSGWVASDVRALTSDPGSERRPGVSPDGTRVAYGQLDPAGGDKSVDRIMLRAIGSRSPCA